MRREVKSAFVLVGVLLTTLVILAVLQYLWIGDVAEAERQRMQNGLQLATSRFAEEFNGEVIRALMTTSAGQRMQAIDDGNFGQLYLQWRATAAYPAMIKSLFVFDNTDSGNPRLLEFEDKSGVLKSAEWPNELRDVERQLMQEYNSFPGQFEESFAPQPRRNMFLARDPPVAVLPLSQFVQAGPRPAFPWPPFGGPPAKWVIVAFDQDILVKEVFPDLTARYFLPLGEGEYRLAVMTTDEPRRIVYQSNVEPTEGDFSNVDSKADLFGPPGGLNRPAPGPAGPFNLPARRSGHWELLVEHRLGSLDAAANRLYRRNMAVSFGTLIVLVGSVIMIILASERARALANQQIKFAAGVSHELRTPLAAIQALTHNLVTGVIKNPADVQQYARMVHDEARGLTGTVDQVLLFGETRSMRKKYEIGPVEIVEIIDDALATLAPEIHESGCNVISEVPEDAPTLRANATALTHCVRNLVSNAMKYGTKSSSRNSIRIVAFHNEQKREVCIAIIDQGRGIDPADSPHIFEAFYRGRDTTLGKRGAGLGLYLVKQLIEAMGGRISVETLMGLGSTFTLHVPVFAQEHQSGTSHLHR
jgi:signal transduction histidine kinase